MTTGATTPAPPSAEALGAPTRIPGLRAPHPARSLLLRWVFLGLCTVAAFFPTWVRLVREASEGAITAYIFVLPVLAAVAAQGIARRRGGELPIHDRQTDAIAGGLGLIVAVSIEALWLPRYADQYALAHLDVLAGLVFVLSGTILLFGLRPVGRFWSVWLLLLALSPLLYRMTAIALGGSRFAYGAVMVLLAGLAGAIAVGRTRRRAAAGFVTTVAAGLLLLRIMLWCKPDLNIVILQAVPAEGAAVVSGTVYYLWARRGRSKHPLTRTMQPVTARTTRGPVCAFTVAAVVLFFLPLPPVAPVGSTPGPPGRTGEPLFTPAGWTQTDVDHFPWVRSFFGQSSTLMRQTIRADEGNSNWDIQSRPRTIVVDTLSTTNRASLSVYPESTLYRLANTRTSPALPVRLGHDVVGSLYTSVDDALLLTWTKLVFTWVRGPVTQRVTLISVDNHDDGALFPEPAPSMASNLGTSIATFLRGNTIAQDDHPDYKDRTLLSAVGTLLVSAQWAEESDR